MDIGIGSGNVNVMCARANPNTLPLPFSLSLSLYTTHTLERNLDDSIFILNMGLIDKINKNIKL